MISLITRQENSLKHQSHDQTLSLAKMATMLSSEENFLQVRLLKKTKRKNKKMKQRKKKPKKMRKNKIKSQIWKHFFLLWKHNNIIGVSNVPCVAGVQKRIMWKLKVLVSICAFCLAWPRWTKKWAQAYANMHRKTYMYTLMYVYVYKDI